MMTRSQSRTVDENEDDENEEFNKTIIQASEDEVSKTFQLLNDRIKELEARLAECNLASSSKQDANTSPMSSVVQEEAALPGDDVTQNMPRTVSYFTTNATAMSPVPHTTQTNDVPSHTMPKPWMLSHNSPATVVTQSNTFPMTYTSASMPLCTTLLYGQMPSMPNQSNYPPQGATPLYGQMPSMPNRSSYPPQGATPLYEQMPSMLHQSGYTPQSQARAAYFPTSNCNQMSASRIHDNYTLSSQTPRKLYDLPEFDGRSEDWPMFIKSYTESTVAYKYTMLENAFRMQKALKGAAKEEVETMLIDPRNVPAAIEQLEFRFGQPEQLIKSQLAKLKEIPYITENRIDKIVPFATKVRNLTTFLKTAGAIPHLRNPMLIEELVTKLPMSKRLEWTAYIMQLTPYPSLEHFAEWIQGVARLVSKTMISSASTSITSHRNESKTVLTVTNKTNANQVTSKECTLCTAPHHLSVCPTFQGKNVEERWNTVKVNRLCFACLNRGHGMMQCRKKKACKINECKRVHHPLLHDKIIDKAMETNNNNAAERVNTVHRNVFHPESTKVLFKVVPVELRGQNNVVVKVYAMLDEGSSCTLIAEKIVEQLGVTNERNPLTLQWFGGRQTEIQSMSVKISIKGVKHKQWYDMVAKSTNNLGLPIQTVNLSEIHQKYQQIKKLPIAEYSAVEPMLLIGIDNCHLVAGLKSVQCGQSIVATKTALGWVVYGHVGSQEETMESVFSVVLHSRVRDDDETTSDTQESLHSLVADYFTTENFGTLMNKPNAESKDIIRARTILKDTTKKIGDRYECGLLWKSDNIQLPNSYAMAKSRFDATERKMMKNEHFAQAYKNAVTNLLNSDYARKLTEDEARCTTPLTWYLPHFAVYNVNKPNKVRLVFDAAASVNNISLNSMLLKGPDEMQPLIKILLQFREGNIAVCADIKEMFLQVRIMKRDQDAQRFLWRSSPEAPLETYVMSSMIFGATCSPCIAQYVKNVNALTEAADRPEVQNAIINSHYVDDYVISFQSVKEAVAVSHNVVNTHKKAGLLLRGFVSNSLEVQQQLSVNNESAQPMVNMNASEQVDRVLGLYWDSQSDQLLFKTNFHKVNPLVLSGEKCPTKRQLLSLVMSVYDPLGIIADIVIYGKILLQNLWRHNLNWDDEIPENINEQFKEWVTTLPQLEQIRIPRCYAPEFRFNEIEVYLHIFVDASEQAFAAVAYWQIYTPMEIKVSFVMGKTRCAPLKILSVPRLELQAAVLGVRIKEAILQSHTIKPGRTIFWTDSKTVLCWINSDHRQYKPFVAHRVGEILEHSKENDWRWLPTNLNVADEATRQKRIIKNWSHRIWNRGPEFLKQPEMDWPSFPVCCKTNDSQDEMKRRITLVLAVNNFVDLNRFSNYLRLKRCMGWVLRFIKNVRSRSYTGELTVDELNEAETKLIIIVQNESFAEEKQQLLNDEPIAKNSSLFKLTPQLDEMGLIRVQGRIDYAAVLEPATKKPIILPYRHEFTEKIVQWYHMKLYHQNTELVVNEIRKKFWVIHVRSAVKRAQLQCQYCANNRAMPKPPLMGQLPRDRLTPYIRPFTYVGLDYFGPIMVTIGRRNEKRWAALFTCLTIRAVHIELAHDLSTDACILCIRNFVNRRGIPMKIRSDMGTNFVGANGELQKINDLFDMQYIQNELSTKNITWEFNCPANPSSGGCWERLIQSTKKVLAVTLKTKAPQVETLRSLLIEAENIINSRPLTHLPISPEEPEPLTPNHFLLGTTNSTQTPFSEYDSIVTRKQFRISQQLKNEFWRRWVREFLPTLTKRTKWFKDQKPIEVGNVVVMCEESLPRSEWKKGRVSKVIKAQDGQIRVVEIETAQGYLRRPVSKLAVLDVIE